MPKKINNNKRQENLPPMSKIIKDMGQKDEAKGVAAVAKYMGLIRKNEAKEEIAIKKKLDRLSRGGDKKKYFEALFEILQLEIKDLDLPKNFLCWGEMNPQGIIIRLRYIDTNKNYHCAFKPKMDAKVDYGAIIELLGRAIDTAIKAQDDKYRNLTKAGIVLPA